MLALRPDRRYPFPIPARTLLSSRAVALLTFSSLAAGLIPVAVTLGAVDDAVAVDVADDEAEASSTRVVALAAGEPLLDDSEARLLRTQAQVRTSRSAARAPLRVLPADGAVTGWFGEPRRRHVHGGVDFDGETGDVVRAAADGEVLHAGPAPTGYGGYGTMVVVGHGDGVETLYAHLSAVTVGVGHVVRAGDAVGAIGTTGSVTGSHLHFEVLVGGVRVDPLAWLG